MAGIGTPSQAATTSSLALSSPDDGTYIGDIKFGEALPDTAAGDLAAIVSALGGTLTVDGSGVTQPVSGTVTANAGTNLNTSALLTENTFTGRIGEVQASPTANTVLARLKDINDAQLADGHNVTIDNVSIPVTGTFWQATQPVSLASVPSHAVTNAGTFAVQASGSIAHDSVDSGSPVKNGNKAIDHGTNPTAVAAGDRTDAYANRAGVPFVIGGHPNILSQNLQVTDADGAQTDTAIITAAAGTAIVVTAIEVTADNANTVDVSCRIGFGTANTPAADAAKVILFHPGIPAGSGVVKGTGAGIIGMGASDEDLRVTCEDPVTGSISITVTYYTIAIG